MLSWASVYAVGVFVAIIFLRVAQIDRDITQQIRPASSTGAQWGLCVLLVHARCAILARVRYDTLIHVDVTVVALPADEAVAVVFGSVGVPIHPVVVLARAIVAFGGDTRIFVVGAVETYPQGCALTGVCVDIVGAGGAVLTRRRNTLVQFDGAVLVAVRAHKARHACARVAHGSDGSIDR
jgi:hypothetical protein